MTIFGFIRHGYKDEDIGKKQKKHIQAFVKKNDLTINKWLEEEKYWEYDSTFFSSLNFYGYKSLSKGDIVIVSSFSQLGNSMGQVVKQIDKFLQHGVNIYSAEEDMKLGHFLAPNQYLRERKDEKAEVFSVLAQLEKKIASERSTQSLRAAKDKGKRIGRPKGRLGKSKLDGKEKEIQEYLHKGVTKANICKIFLVSWPTLDNFIKTRKLSETKAIKVEILLTVENNNKYVRGRSKAIKDIERFLLSHYNMKKIDEGWRYELTVSYENKEDLDRTMDDIHSEIHSQADMRNCYAELDINALDGSERYW